MFWETWEVRLQQWLLCHGKSRTHHALAHAMCSRECSSMSAFVTSSPLRIRSLGGGNKHLPESWKSNQTTHWHLRVNSSSPEWTRSDGGNGNSLIFSFQVLWTLDGYKTTDAASLLPPRLPLWLQWADDQRYLGGEKKTFAFDFSDSWASKIWSGEGEKKKLENKFQK